MLYVFHPSKGAVVEGPLAGSGLFRETDNISAASVRQCAVTTSYLEGTALGFAVRRSPRGNDLGPSEVDESAISLLYFLGPTVFGGIHSPMGPAC